MFNSAGERVVVLHEALGLADAPVAVEGPAQAFAHQDGQQALFRLVGTTEVITWDGTNDQAQLVDSGTYTIKVTLTDRFGKITTLQGSAQAVSSRNPVTVKVFNTAGEVVWNTTSFNTSAPSGLAVSREQAVSDLPTPADRQVQIRWGPGVSDQVTWDGRGSNGQVLDSGLYRVEVSRGPGESYSAAVQVLSAGLGESPSAQAFDLAATGKIHVRTDSGSRLEWVRLYNLAGELVLESSPGSSAAVFDMPSLASGIYLVTIEIVAADGSRQKTTHKLGVIR